MLCEVLSLIYKFAILETAEMRDALSDYRFE